MKRLDQVQPAIVSPTLSDHFTCAATQCFMLAMITCFWWPTLSLIIKGSLEQPHGMNLNQFHIRGFWVFTHELFMLPSLLGLRRPFLCSRVFCSIFPFHFWFHEGMFWSGLESKNHHAGTGRHFESVQVVRHSRLGTTPPPPNISTPWLWTGKLAGERGKNCLIQILSEWFWIEFRDLRHTMR